MNIQPMRMSVFFCLWPVLCLRFGHSASPAFKSDDKKKAFDRFTLNQVLKAVHPLDQSDLKYAVDGTVDQQILTPDDLGACGCLRPERSPSFFHMVRKYTYCELAVLEANPSPHPVGCYELATNKCHLTLSSTLTYSQLATGGWKVGAKITIGDLEVSTKYGEPWQTSELIGEPVQLNVTLDPGQTAIPYVIVGGVRCWVEIHGVEKELVGKLKGEGSKYENEISCAQCDLSCADFLDGSALNDFSRYNVVRECLYHKPSKGLYPITRDPVVPCRTDKPPFFKGYMTMPLYDRQGKLIKVHTAYVTSADDIKN